MTERDILLPVAVLTILRGEETVRGVADRLGVTEAEVERWKDIFVVAGALALRELRGNSHRHAFAAEDESDEFHLLFTTTPDPG